MPAQKRSLKVLCRHPLIARIQTPRDSASYVFVPFKTDFGRGFRVSRLDEAGREIEDRVYNCLLWGRKSTCECKGWCARGKCRHISALRTIFKGGPEPGMVTIKCKVVETREKSVRILVEGGKRVWLPLSQVKVESDGVVAPEWLAREKGIA